MIVQFHFEVRKRTKREERKKNTEAKRNHKLHLVRLVSWLVYSIATLYMVQVIYSWNINFTTTNINAIDDWCRIVKKRQQKNN